MSISELHRNRALRMDGLMMLKKMASREAACAFFDPQYRGDLDKLNYGNEKTGKGRRRAGLAQMDDLTITMMCSELSRVVRTSGHVFLWVNKFHLCERRWAKWVPPGLDLVDMVVWDKVRIGMGYRTRRRSEYCLVLQNPPQRAKGEWRSHDVPDVWKERVRTKTHPHAKPQGLARALIAAVTDVDDLVVDPAAGSFGVMRAAHETGRQFMGCDVAPLNPEGEIQ